MSHNVSITGIKITSLPALELACAELQKEGVNVMLERGANRSLKFRTYSAGIKNDDTADCVIRLPGGAYDIGLVRQPGGHYAPVYDNALGISVACPIACDLKPGNRFDYRAITDKAELELAGKGIGIGKLMQRYTAIVAEMDAKRKGYIARRVTNPNGAIQVLITVNH